MTIAKSRKHSGDAYDLRITADGAFIEAANRGGAWCGLQTLQQWLAIDSRWCRELRVKDVPAFTRRGVTLDISRCRVPRMAELFSLVDRLAGWKINQLQLYTEHTFAYRGHEEVWRESSPMTGEQIRQLDAYCHQRCIELIPNQNSFGHLHRWLKMPAYRHLAECPDGIEHPFAARPEPYGLCPTDPAVEDFLADLYSQLLPHFHSRQFHVGCDETIDLGQCRSRQQAAENGKTSLFVDHVVKLRRLAARWDRKIQIWADMLIAHPEMTDQIPGDVRLQLWGYEADHPFADQLAQLAGRDVDVCAGTSSWGSLAGRTGNALENLRQAGRGGNGLAQGLIVTDWGDFGHPQPPSVSLPGFLAGADVAWTGSGRSDSDYEELLERELGDGAGRALFALGNVYSALKTPCYNGTPLFHLLFHWRDPLTHGRYDGLDQPSLEEAQRRTESIAVPDAQNSLHRQLVWLQSGLVLACRLGRLRLQSEDDLATAPAEERLRLRKDLREWREDYVALWLSTSRPGGLAESLAPIDSLVEALGSSSMSASS